MLIDLQRIVHCILTTWVHCAKGLCFNVFIFILLVLTYLQFSKKKKKFTNVCATGIQSSITILLFDYLAAEYMASKVILHTNSLKLDLQDTGVQASHMACVCTSVVAIALSVLLNQKVLSC